MGDPGWALRAARIHAAATIAAGWYLTGLDIPAVPPRGALENLLTEGIVAWRCVGLLLVPAGQVLVHQVHWVGTPLDPAGLILLAVAPEYQAVLRLYPGHDGAHAGLDACR